MRPPSPCPHRLFDAPEVTPSRKHSSLYCGLLLFSSALVWCLLAWRGSERVITLADDGAVCWFQDPRGLTANNKTYAGWISSTGDIGVSSYNHATGARTSVIIHAKLQVNDHVAPSLMRLPDGRIAVFYCKHNSPIMKLSVSELPDDASVFTPWRKIYKSMEGIKGQGITYPSPWMLSDGRVAVFYRGIQWQPTVMFSDANLTEWTSPVHIFLPKGERAYTKFRVSGDKVHMIATDGHPKTMRNKVYYAYLKGNTWFKANGTSIKELSAGPLTPSEVDLVYDASQGTAWVWDIAITADGLPVAAFTASRTTSDHVYMFAYWAPDKAGWKVSRIASGGGWFPQTPAGQTEAQPYYSGGLALEPIDPFTAYLSRPVDGVFVIEQWRSPDKGGTWQPSGTPLSAPMGKSSVRPFVPHRSSVMDGPATVAWMHLSGHYKTYYNYSTSIEMAVLNA